MKRDMFLNAALCCIGSLVFASSAQTPMTDASGTYSYKNENFKLGLYDGTNEIPEEHLAKGYEIATEMREMGTINIVPIGHSVPTGIFQGWNWDGNMKSQYKLADNLKHSNACGPAVMAWNWLSNISRGGNLGGVSANDLHVLVVQLTWAPFFGPDNYEMNTPLSEKIDSMSHDLGRLAADAKRNYPNLKMILFQADPWQNNHEPYHAYHEWFFSRQVVMDQINDASDYTGPGVDEVWLGMGGYFWKANDNGSYYTDCCHLSGSGTSHFRDEWIKALLDQNPVVSHWLLKDPPKVPVNIQKMMKPASSLLKLSAAAAANGVRVTFSLPRAATIDLGLFSVDGRTVVHMSEKACAAGANTIALTGGRLPAPGAYVVRMSTGTRIYSVPLAIADY